MIKKFLSKAIAPKRFTRPKRETPSPEELPQPQEHSLTEKNGEEHTPSPFKRKRAPRKKNSLSQPDGATSGDGVSPSDDIFPNDDSSVTTPKQRGRKKILSPSQEESELHQKSLNQENTSTNSHTSPEADSPKQAAPTSPPKPLIPIAATLSINELQQKSYQELLDLIEKVEAEPPKATSRHQLINSLARHQISAGGELTAKGILEFSPQHPFLRWPQFNFLTTPEDLVVPVPLLKKYSLRPGIALEGKVSIFDGRYMGLTTITKIEDIPEEKWSSPPEFERLTPAFPNRRVLLEQPGDQNITARAIDLIAPLGMGQRGLIAAPPRSGKTVLLKNLAKAIETNHPEAHLMLLLIDERPEEVTDLKRSLRSPVFSSTFDEPKERHVHVTEMISERAKRLVELGKDVIILIDSITRLSRGYNNMTSGKGRTLSGGIDSKALAGPKRFFGSARNTEEGGSLTILATALVHTKSRMDDLIFEEYKGTGNMEIVLDPHLVEQRVFPALHLTESATRKEELLYHPQELERIHFLRRQLSELPAAEGTQLFLENISATNSNAELLLSGIRGIYGR